MSKNVEKQIYANGSKGDAIYRLVDPATEQKAYAERVTAVKENPLRMEIAYRHASDGYRMYRKASVGSVQSDF